MWKWIAEDKMPIAGVGSGDLTDEEFDEREAEYERGFPGIAPGVLKRSGLFQHLPDPKPGKADKDEE